MKLRMSAADKSNCPNVYEHLTMFFSFMNSLEGNKTSLEHVRRALIDLHIGNHPLRHNLNPGTNGIYTSTLLCLPILITTPA